MFRRIAFFAAVLAAFTVTGCASVKMASPEADAQAKTFQVAPDKANIYVYRNETFGAAIKMPVLLDERLAGDTAAMTYIFKSVTPGKHTLVSKTENDSELSINAEAGKNYFVWQEVKMGAFSAGSKLQQVDEAKGQAAVKECKRVE